MALVDIELLVFAQKNPDRDGRSWKLRLVHWAKDGRGTAVLLERREFFEENGKTRMGRAKGLSLEDLMALRPHWPKMIQLMKAPPPIPGPQQEYNEEEPIP